MNLSRLTLLALALSPLALSAQTDTSTEPPAGTTDCSKISKTTYQALCAFKYAQTKIIHLNNTGNQNDANEILVAVRNNFRPDLKIYLMASQEDIVLNTYPEELARAEALIHSLDKPHPTYKLTYTVAEFDAGKNLGIQHFSIVAGDGQRTTLKQGDKVPVATGSFSTEHSAAQTQFTYLDVGMNFDATVNGTTGGVVLKSRVEQSSVGPTTMIADVAEPVVRQTVLDSIFATPLNKPLKLGSIDVPNSTRHIDIDVVVEQLK